MENSNQFKQFTTFQTHKSQQGSPLQANSSFTKCLDVHWKYLLARIYQNINEPVLKKKKSYNSIHQQQLSQVSQTTAFKCSCKKTKCLKLYCQCFSRGQYCNSCNCQTCNNNSQFDVLRSSIIDQIIQKNPNAFDLVQKTKNISCICKKTGCLKKYCQCFNVGKKCNQECKCANCENHS